MHRSRPWLAAAWAAWACCTLSLPTPSLAQDAKAITVKQVPAGTPLQADPQGPPLRARRFFVLPTNEVVGKRREGFFCRAEGEIQYNQALGATIMQQAAAVARRELAQAGYRQPPESAFQGATQDADVEYELAATLVDVQANLCMDGNQVRRGELWISLDWEVFSPRERRVVQRLVREGSHSAAEPQLLADFLAATVKSAVRNLLADPGFHGQVTKRTAVAQGSAPPGEVLAVARRHTGGGTLAARMPELQSAVATVFVGTGSGSAFLVGADGWWLTNQHVVGDARFVRVRLASGRELNGEVMRSAARRDVALIRTEPVALAPMALSEGELGVGSEVTALGSPLGERVASSVARGIVSSYRDIDEQRWLQSDVQVLPGSSGGPLVSGEGAVVALTSRGTRGIVLFVPIREALQALNLTFAEPPR